MAGLTRKEMKHDEFLETATEAGHWLEQHWKTVALAVGAVFVLLIAVLGWRQWSISRDAAAADALSRAQAVYLAIDDPFAVGPTTLDDALTAFREAADEAGSHAAGTVARFYEGIVLMRLGRPAEAIEPLRSAASAAAVDPLLRQNARVALGRALAATGDLDGADRTLREAAADETAPFPPEQALMTLSDLRRSAGDAAGADDVLREIVQRFPGTAAAQQAGRELGQ